MRHIRNNDYKHILTDVLFNICRVLRLAADRLMTGGNSLVVFEISTPLFPFHSFIYTGEGVVVLLLFIAPGNIQTQMSIVWLGPHDAQPS